MRTIIICNWTLNKCCYIIDRWMCLLLAQTVNSWLHFWQAQTQVTFNGKLRSILCFHYCSFKFNGQEPKIICRFYLCFIRILFKYSYCHWTETEQLHLQINDCILKIKKWTYFHFFLENFAATPQNRLQFLNIALYYLHNLSLFTISYSNLQAIQSIKHEHFCAEIEVQNQVQNLGCGSQPPQTWLTGSMLSQ